MYEESMKEYYSLPNEIRFFLLRTFDIIETRKRVGEYKGVIFMIHTKETGHYRAHVHAEYSGKTVTIYLDNFDVMGNLGGSKNKEAVSWVKDHQEKLLTIWKDIAFSGMVSF